MHPRLPARCLLLAALLLIAAVPAAPAAAATKPPAITKVSPMRVKVGSILTIRGKNFSPRRARNTVFFRGPGGGVALVKPSRASRTKLVVKVPASVFKLLSKRNGSAVATRFKLRVLTRKFSKFTPARLSPVVAATGAPSGSGGSGSGGSGGSGSGSGGVSGTAAPSGCSGTDSDSDLLSDSLETQIRTNPCDADSDDDGVEDGFEYQSARDLNDDENQNPNSYLPYPGQRPYANPLFADSGKDYDGDSLTLLQEYILWNYTITNGATRTLSPLTYSDGEQYSVFARDGAGHRVPTLQTAGYSRHAAFMSWAAGAGYDQVELQDGAPWYDGSQRNSYDIRDFNRDDSVSTAAAGGYWRPEETYFDFDQDGFLSDNERDEDADGLTNFDETHGRARADYWRSCYGYEAGFPISYDSTDLTDPDSDDDGVRDGADDQDHDDVPNLMELSRNAASGLDDTSGATCTPAEGLPEDFHHASAYGRVDPYNPCLPATWSRTCTRHPSFGAFAAPFDGSANWYSLN